MNTSGGVGSLVLQVRYEVVDIGTTHLQVLNGLNIGDLHGPLYDASRRNCIPCDDI